VLITFFSFLFFLKKKETKRTCSSNEKAKNLGKKNETNKLFILRGSKKLENPKKKEKEKEKKD